MDPIALGFASYVAYNIGTGVVQHDPIETPHHHYAEVQCIDEGHSWPGFLVDETVAQVRTSEFVLCIEEKVNVQLQEKLEIRMKSDLRLKEIEQRLKEIFEKRDRLIEESKKEKVNGI